MDKNDLTLEYIVTETHAGFERQGFGSPEATLKALGFAENFRDIKKALDIGCGTGGQTLALAQNISGGVVGMDICPQFIDVLNSKAARLGLQERVKGMTGSMDALPFAAGEFGLVWCEGVLDSNNFKQMLAYWNTFLAGGGHAAVSCPAWISDRRPSEVENFWGGYGCALESIGGYISMMHGAGFNFVAAFALPEECWTDNYFVPRAKADNALAVKYPNSEVLKAYIAENKEEADLYEKFNKDYGYFFYWAKKQLTTLKKTFHFKPLPSVWLRRCFFLAGAAPRGASSPMSRRKRLSRFG
ncbi:MAG: class I SAM-dependent methyltransferase [Defluviitaleaceae bacterium]|nr:class I SAM-dependent methyltransferase [Defluviitaleaceae bacterium]